MEKSTIVLGVKGLNLVRDSRSRTQAATSN